MSKLDNSRAFGSAIFLDQRRAMEAVEKVAATFAKNPKLRGTVIVVADENGNIVSKIAVPSQH